MSQQAVIQLVEFIIGLAVLIVVHELGHYLAARWFNIEVEEFGIGFPPRALKLFTYKGTLFSLNWIPLGGFARIKGQDDPEVEGGMAAASPWARLGVLAAGPIMNLVVGSILAVAFFLNIGEPDKVNIAGIAPGSPAEVAGLMTGDIILQANGKEIKTHEDLYNIIYGNLGTPITLLASRDGQTFEISLTPRNPPPSEGAIGIAMGYTTKPTTLLRALSRGVITTIDYARSVIALPVRMLQGQTTPEETRLIGYKGMFDVYQQIQSPLDFFMIISLSLGIFNLFPIPALDGGRILFTLPELVFKRRIPARYENFVHLVGFTLLILLLIYSNIQDFVNPIQLPR